MGSGKVMDNAMHQVCRAPQEHKGLLLHTVSREVWLRRCLHKA